MAASYAVFWRDGDGPVSAGELELLESGCRLDGSDRSGADATQELHSDEIASLAIGRTPEDRIDGRSSLVVERSSGGRLLIASAAGIGMLHEIAERLNRSLETKVRA